MNLIWMSISVIVTTDSDIVTINSDDCDHYTYAFDEIKRIFNGSGCYRTLLSNAEA